MPNMETYATEGKHLEDTQLSSSVFVIKWDGHKFIRQKDRKYGKLTACRNIPHVLEKEVRYLCLVGRSIKKMGVIVPVLCCQM
jgi:hypothetical protein